MTDIIWNIPYSRRMIQRRQSIWKFGVSSFRSHPLHSLPLSPSFPLPFPFFPPPLPPSPSPTPGAPLNQLGGLGERCKLPQWGLGRSPSQQTIWCISGPKGAALFCVSFFAGTTGPSYHFRIVCENDWIELAISSQRLCLCPQRVGLWPLPGSAATVMLGI